MIPALNMGPETVVGQLRPTMTDRAVRNHMANKNHLQMHGKANLVVKNIKQ